jgi:hypothetical protein
MRITYNLYVISKYKYEYELKSVKYIKIIDNNIININKISIVKYNFSDLLLLINDLLILENEFLVLNKTYLLILLKKEKI